MKRLVVLALWCSCALPSFAASSAVPEVTAVDSDTSAPQPPSPALMVSTDSAGGLFAPGSVSVFRIMNPSSDLALGPISATLGAKVGFTVVSNTCAKGLPARASCSVSVAWNPAGELSSTDLIVSSSSPKVEVRSSLRGDRHLSR